MYFLPLSLRTLSRRRISRARGAKGAFLVLLTACAGGSARPATTSVLTVTTAASSTTTSTVGPAAVAISLRVERHVADPETEDFEATAIATLTDPRGWSRAGFSFTFDAPDAPYTMVLAEGDEVDQLCLPYDTYGLYSCQNGPVVALNADRWRAATPEWTGDLPTYRRMLVNHEVGHLLGMHHPAIQCPVPDAPAPVMAQQSTELNGCLPNPWPLDDEVACAARHDQPIAPPFEPDPTGSCQ